MIANKSEKVYFVELVKFCVKQPEKETENVLQGNLVIYAILFDFILFLFFFNFFIFFLLYHTREKFLKIVDIYLYFIIFNATQCSINLC